MTERRARRPSLTRYYGLDKPEPANSSVSVDGTPSSDTLTDVPVEDARAWVQQVLQETPLNDLLVRARQFQEDTDELESRVNATVVQLFDAYNEAVRACERLQREAPQWQRGAEREQARLDEALAQSEQLARRFADEQQRLEALEARRRLVQLARVALAASPILTQRWQSGETERAAEEYLQLMDALERARDLHPVYGRLVEHLASALAPYVREYVQRQVERAVRLEADESAADGMQRLRRAARAARCPPASAAAAQLAALVLQTLQQSRAERVETWACTAPSRLLQQYEALQAWSVGELQQAPCEAQLHDSLQRDVQCALQSAATPEALQPLAEALASAPEWTALADAEARTALAVDALSDVCGTTVTDAWPALLQKRVQASGAAEEEYTACASEVDALARAVNENWEAARRKLQVWAATPAMAESGAEAVRARTLHPLRQEAYALVRCGVSRTPASLLLLARLCWRLQRPAEAEAHLREYTQCAGHSGWDEAVDGNIGEAAAIQQSAMRTEINALLHGYAPERVRALQTVIIERQRRAGVRASQS